MSTCTAHGGPTRPRAPLMKSPPLQVSDGLTGEGLESVLTPVLDAAVDRYEPQAIICCAGTGTTSRIHSLLLFCRL